MALASAIVERARALAEPLAERMGFDLIDVEYRREGSTWYLRVYIDVRGGIHIDDCERLSKAYSDILDREDFIEQSYVLEVSSPGIDRPLKTESDFRRYEGARLELKMKTGTPGKVGKTGAAADITGTLVRFEGGRLYLTDKKGAEFSVAWDEVKTAKRAIEWN